jgi:hypothetical protein
LITWSRMFPEMPDVGVGAVGEAFADWIKINE